MNIEKNEYKKKINIKKNEYKKKMNIKKKKKNQIKVKV